MVQGLWKARGVLRNGSLSNYKAKRYLGTSGASIRIYQASTRIPHHARDAKQISGQATAVHHDQGSLYGYIEDPRARYDGVHPLQRLIVDQRPPPTKPVKKESALDSTVQSDLDHAARALPVKSMDSHARLETKATHAVSIPVHEEKEPLFWTEIPLWRDITSDEFISQNWQTRHSVDKKKIERFLLAVLPEKLSSKNPLLQHIQTREDFIREAKAALEMAPMTIKLSPYILSRINWKDPLDDPIRLQFIPLKSNIIPDHPSLTLDSLGEEEDSPVPGLVHRYPGKALFLSTSICPVYCSFCTRAYAVGPETSSTDKKPQKPSRERWEVMFKYIEENETLHDIVVSGGDTYMLAPDHLRLIGERLLKIPHIRRFRIASKGLAVNPCRVLDQNDSWTSTLVDLAKQGRQLGKQVCWHTHFNHPNEISWITKKAALLMCQQGLVIRNQTVLLKGVNDHHETLGELIKTCADMNIEPYYVYICDLVKGVEHLRTTLQDLLTLDKSLRGTLTGFMMPDFVVDLPGGGGKRLASTYETYSPETGISTWRAPGLPDEKGKREYTYYDPHPWTESPENITKLRKQQDLMYKHKTTREVKDDCPDEPEARPCETYGTGSVSSNNTSPTTTHTPAPSAINPVQKPAENVSKAVESIPSAKLFTPAAQHSGTISLSHAPSME